eukprot:TRINITY_DN12687_c0_g1_i1.p1 TRINITY_DN12687_c0_g1~~TRINITY_DN12687_c0_g1_i1.p1  ORF type:complete len:176 (+),score=24.60 TRINITY_DN12687_c0_g1_i1:56-583(+)
MAHLWRTLMSVLDGSIFVTNSEPPPPPPQPSSHETSQPPEYRAIESSHTALHKRLARARGPTETKQLLRSYLNQPTSEPLASQDVIDVVLQYGTNDALKVALCDIVGQAALMRGRVNVQAVVAVTNAISKPCHKVAAIRALLPALALGDYNDQAVILQQLPANSPERDQVNAMLA